MTKQVSFTCRCGTVAMYPRVSANTELPTASAKRDGWSFIARSMGVPEAVCPRCSAEKQAGEP